MPAYEERKIKVPGFTLALKVWNPKAPSPVLALHGKMDNAASFDFLAPLLPQLQIVAIDHPGTGLSSAYPPGILPHWKSDSFLLLHLIKALNWDQFDIIAHSLGSVMATCLAIALPQQVRKVVFLDILGPTVNFIENGTTNIHRDVAVYLKANEHPRTVYPDLEAAIQDRMKTGNISHQAACALVERGTQRNDQGWSWTFDQRLRCLSSTIPYEDEVRASFKAIEAPVCLVRAKQGVPYPESTFQARSQAIKNLVIHEVAGGHHVHMDDPAPVAAIISNYLGS